MGNIGAMFRMLLISYLSVSSTAARRNPCVIPFFPINIVAIEKQESSIALLVYTQSRASIPSWFRVPFTSLSTQNRLYSVNTSLIRRYCIIRESAADWWSGPSPQGMLLRAFTRNQQYVFLPLLTSFSECIHAHRFRSRCSHTVLYTHYKLASQH